MKNRITDRPKNPIIKKPIVALLAKQVMSPVRERLSYLAANPVVWGKTYETL